MSKSLHRSGTVTWVPGCVFVSAARKGLLNKFSCNQASVKLSKVLRAQGSHGGCCVCWGVAQHETVQAPVCSPNLSLQSVILSGSITANFIFSSSPILWPAGWHNRCSSSKTQLPLALTLHPSDVQRGLGAGCVFALWPCFMAGKAQTCVKVTALFELQHVVSRKDLSRHPQFFVPVITAHTVSTVKGWHHESWGSPLPCPCRNALEQWKWAWRGIKANWQLCTSLWVSLGQQRGRTSLAGLARPAHSKSRRL